MKKKYVILLGILCSILLLSGCTQNQNRQEGIQIVASFYPLAFFAKEIGGDHVTVTQLIPDNTELHAWQPAISDITAASNADILLYNGAHLDHWFEEDILSSIDTTGKIIVETTKGIKLIERETEQTTRLFLFDNDNKRTLVYDLDAEGHSALQATLIDVAVDVLPPFSGYFDTPPLVQSNQGYWYLFCPRTNEVVVLNTGVHGDHFHDAEVLKRIPAGKPVHSAVSPDGKWVAFSEDAEKKILVIPVSAPAQYAHYANGGAASESHATIAFDEEGMIYSGDMETGSGSNLLVLYANNGTMYRTGDAGKSPHGAVYSSETKQIYFNCADGITSVSKNNDEGSFSYSHLSNNGFRLVRSWISHDGKSLVSYVRNLANGLEYDSVVVYDLITGTLTHEIDVNITAVSLKEYGYANSEFIASHGIVLLADPEQGYVHLVNIETEAVISLPLDGTFPQAMRITIDQVTKHAWVVTKDGHVFMIHPEEADIEAKYHLEGEFGINFVLATLTPKTTGHEHEGEDHESEEHDYEGLYDPHTWISPFIAMQQAEKIYDALVQKDPDHTEYYTQRWNVLKQRFSVLDTSFQDELSSKQKDAIFVTHAAFGYLANRYGFHQHGVIGLSADEQPSASTIATLVRTMIEHEIYVVFIDPVYSDSYAQTLKSTLESQTGKTVQILTLYLMVGTTNGLDYFEQQEKNLENLKIGLQAS